MHHRIRATVFLGLLSSSVTLMCGLDPAWSQKPGSDPEIVQRPEWSIGDWWEFRSASDRWRLTVFSRDGAQYVLVRTAENERAVATAGKRTYLVDLDGRFTKTIEPDGKAKDAGDKYDWVQFPLKVGKRWSFFVYSTSVQGSKAYYSYFSKVEGWESIQIGTRTIRTLKVSYLSRNRDMPGSFTLAGWYAPDAKFLVRLIPDYAGGPTVQVTAWNVQSGVPAPAVASPPAPPGAVPPIVTPPPVLSLPAQSAGGPQPSSPPLPHVEQPVVAEQPVPSKPPSKAVPQKAADPVVAQQPAPKPVEQPVPAEKSARGITDMKKGEGGGPVQGSAGPTGSQGAASDLERCEKPIATLALVEPQSAVAAALGSYGLGSPTGLIRLMVQQSNCFLVVERGAGMQNVLQERALSGSGQLRQGSNMGGGQMITADYVMTPSVVFSEGNAGGIGGAVGGLIGHFVPGGAAIGGVAGGLKFKEAQTTLLVADTRSSLQVASGTGSAKKADFNLGGVLLGSGAGAALGAYENTNEGKVVAASFLDNYKAIVKQMRGNPSLQREVGSVALEAAARPQAGAVFNEGDVLRPKIANVKLLAKPMEAADTVAVLAKTDELVLVGKEQDGFLNVETAKGNGWVKKILVTR